MSMRAVRHPLVAIPLVLVGAMVYTHHPDQGAALAHTVGATYGTTTGIAVGSAPDIINGFSDGLNAMGGASGGAAATRPGGSVTPNGPIQLAPRAPSLGPVLK